MISAVHPVAITVLPPERRAPEPLALPAPGTTSAQTVIEPDHRRVGPVRAAVDAYTETQARQAHFLAEEGPAHREPFRLATQNLAKDDLLALHRFAQSPSLTIEPYGEAAQAYAQVQGLTGQVHKPVDISV